MLHWAAYPPIRHTVPLQRKPAGANRHNRRARSNNPRGAILRTKCLWGLPAGECARPQGLARPRLRLDLPRPCVAARLRRLSAAQCGDLLS